MSRSSDAVKKWRKKTKEKLINFMGGCCAVCKYSNQIALCFHHLDPSQKDFTFSSMRTNPKSLGEMVEEIKKCILLCHNCHNEFHAGLIELPAIHPNLP